MDRSSASALRSAADLGVGDGLLETRAALRLPASSVWLEARGHRVGQTTQRAPTGEAAGDSEAQERTVPQGPLSCWVHTLSVTRLLLNGCSASQSALRAALGGAGS